MVGIKLESIHIPMKMYPRMGNRYKNKYGAYITLILMSFYKYLLNK